MLHKDGMTGVSIIAKYIISISFAVKAFNRNANRAHFRREASRFLQSM